MTKETMIELIHSELNAQYGDKTIGTYALAGLLSGLVDKVTLEQYEQIKNVTNLVIDGISYSIDVKANENSFLIVEPTKYKTDNNNKRYYRWCKTPYFNKEIQILPEWILNLIKQNKISSTNPAENQDLIIT